MTDQRDALADAIAQEMSKRTVEWLVRMGRGRGPKELGAAIAGVCHGALIQMMAASDNDLEAVRKAWLGMFDDFLADQLGDEDAPEDVPDDLPVGLRLRLSANVWATYDYLADRKAVSIETSLPGQAAGFSPMAFGALRRRGLAERREVDGRTRYWLTDLGVASWELNRGRKLGA